MRADLRKLSIGDVFDEAFDLYKRNFGLFLTTAAILYVPAETALGIVQVMADTGPFASVSPSPAEIERAFGLLGVMVVALGIYFFLVSTLSGALTVVASERYLGRPITVGQAYRAMFSSAPRIIAAWFFLGLILTVSLIAVAFVMSIVLVIAMGAAGSTGMADPSLSVVITLIVSAAAFLVGAFVFVGLGIFVTPIVMLERAGPMAALQRNMELIRGRTFRLSLSFIGLGLAIYCINLALAGCIHLGLGMLVYPVLNVSESAQTIIFACVSGVISLFIHPLWMTTFTVLYYDQRVRNEGFDLALMLVDLDTRRMAEARSPEPAA